MSRFPRYSVCRKIFLKPLQHFNNESPVKQTPNSLQSLLSLVSQGQISHLSCIRFLVHLLASAGTFSTSIMSKKNNRSVARKALTHS